MNDAPRRPVSPGAKDSWENLAENLFGIDFGKSAAAGAAASQPKAAPPDDTSPPAADPAPRAATGEDNEATPEAIPVAEPVVDVAEEAALVAADAGFSAGLSEAAEDAVTEESDVAPADDDDSEAAAATDADSSVDEPEDTYWDALKEWKWDDGASGGERVPQQSRSPRKPGRREAPREKPRETGYVARATFEDVEPIIDARDEFVDDPGFGAGLLDDEMSSVAEGAVAEDKAETSGSPSTGEDDTEGEPTRKRRRRRRRRRPRGGDSETPVEGGETEADLESGTEDEVNAAPDTEEAVSEDEPEAKRPPRRRSSRRRRKPAAAPASDVAAAPASDVAAAPASDVAAAPASDVEADDDLEPIGDDAEDESEDEQGESSRKVPAAYRNLPTWEEAVSFLVKKPPTADGRAAENNRGAEKTRSGKGESSRSSGRRGGRRR